MSEHASLPVLSLQKHPSLTVMKKPLDASESLSLLEKQLVDVERELALVAKTAVKSYAKHIIAIQEQRAAEQEQNYQKDASAIIARLETLTQKVQLLADNVELKQSNLELERDVLQKVQTELNK